MAGEQIQPFRSGSLEQDSVPFLELLDDLLDPLFVVLDVDHLAITCTGTFGEPASSSSTDEDEIDMRGGQMTARIEVELVLVFSQFLHRPDNGYLSGGS